MDEQTATLVGALGGGTVVGLFALVTSWLTSRREAARYEREVDDRRAQRRYERELDAYEDLLIELSRVAWLDQPIDKLHGHDFYALTGRVSLYGSAEVRGLAFKAQDAVAVLESCYSDSGELKVNEDSLDKAEGDLANVTLELEQALREGIKSRKASDPTA